MNDTKQNIMKIYIRDYPIKIENSTNYLILFFLVNYYYTKNRSNALKTVNKNYRFLMESFRRKIRKTRCVIATFW